MNLIRGATHRLTSDEIVRRVLRHRGMYASGLKMTAQARTIFDDTLNQIIYRTAAAGHIPSGGA